MKRSQPYRRSSGPSEKTSDACGAAERGADGDDRVRTERATELWVGGAAAIDVSIHAAPRPCLHPARAAATGEARMTGSSVGCVDGRHNELMRSRLPNPALSSVHSTRALTRARAMRTLD